MDFIEYYASTLTLIGSTLLMVVYTASSVLQVHSELKHIKEVRAFEIERARAEAAKKAIADLRKEYQHLAEYKLLRRATEESDRGA